VALAFNLFFAPVSLLLIWLFSENKLPLVLAISVWFIAGLAIAFLTAVDGFNLMCNACWFVFIHLPFVQTTNIKLDNNLFLSGLFLNMDIALILKEKTFM
jgi:hypothetical protein